MMIFLAFAMVSTPILFMLYFFINKTWTYLRNKSKTVKVKKALFTENKQVLGINEEDELAAIITAAVSLYINVESHGK